ncbi:YbjP/YqhG family protein [Chitinophaga filiformis]|uniref:DUF3828 domain-containing protein n=1 Tax=Chitinophaga filiformis TaxID=104663 RepID=UPI001F3A55A1|nr:DUF3828 domain-containing protein [Chitinophaga filiformis]MCF6404249.1 YbjP/YqhG family protein [Chitinophaga filiformis]
MKTQFLASCFVSILICLSSFCQAQNKAPNDSAATMLKQFYTSYISADEESQLTSIKKQYCTKKILNRIAKDEELDADPFLQAQDTDMDWLKTLVISKDAQKPNVYSVSYINNYDKKRIVNKLVVVKVGQTYKIDDILTY